MLRVGSAQYWLFPLLLLLPFLAPGQQYAFRVTLKDKQGAPPLSNPTAFLSQRALDRRAAQNIPLDSLDRPVSPAYIDSICMLTGGVFHASSRWLNHVVILLTDSASILNLQNRPWIAGIRWIAYYAGGLHQRFGPGAPVAAQLSTVKTTSNQAYYGSAWEQFNLIKGTCLHDAGLRGAGKIIAVLDDGFFGVNSTRAYDSLNAGNRIVDTRNFVLATDLVYTSGTHGTQALSTMAAILPDTFVGAAPAASYALYVTEDQNSEQPIEMDNLLAATERADSLGADIVSASIGYNLFYGPLASSSLTLADIDGQSTIAAKAINIASAKGMLCVMSAGNEGGNSWNKILTPGDADSALTVGSVNSAGVPAGNSGYGPNAANITKPDVVALGNPAIVLNSTSVAIGAPGTSFAVPQVAGFAACLWQGNNGATAAQLRRAIRQTANSFANPGPQTGFGVPDFCAALTAVNVPETPAPTTPSLILYPNPAGDLLNGRCDQAARTTVHFEIFDLVGRLMGKVDFPSGAEFSLPIANLPPATYIVVATNEKGMIGKALFQKK